MTETLEDPVFLVKMIEDGEEALKQLEKDDGSYVNMWLEKYGQLVEEKIEGNFSNFLREVLK